MAEPIVAQAVIVRLQTLADGTVRVIFDLQEGQLSEYTRLLELLQTAPYVHLIVEPQPW